MEELIEDFGDTGSTPVLGVTQFRKALKGFTKSFDVQIVNENDPLRQLNETRSVVRKIIRTQLEEMKGIKYMVTLKITLEKQLDSDRSTHKTAFFNYTAATVVNDGDVRSTMPEAIESIMNRIAVWLSEGSGWTIESVDGHYVNVVVYQPLNGTSYIELPEELQNSLKGLVNIKNNDVECFRWCHVRHINPQSKDPQRVKKKDRVKSKELDYEGIEFPVAVKDYNKVEKMNNININVFGYENKQPFPIYISKGENEDHMDLLLITDESGTGGGWYYVYIKEFNRFLYNQTKHEHRKHFCRCCLQCFTTLDILGRHGDNGMAVNGIQAIQMPDETDNTLKFVNFHKQLDVPFVIYADFEAITEKVASASPNNSKSFTEAYQNHVDCGYGFKVVCCDDKYSKPIETYRGKDAVNKFIKRMLEEVKYCKKIKKEKFNEDMIMRRIDKEDFKTATKCHICGKKYTGGEIRVRDHCHITGKYRGSAHRESNINHRLTDKIPVIFHNLVVSMIKGTYYRMVYPVSLMDIVTSRPSLICAGIV